MYSALNLSLKKSPAVTNRVKVGNMISDFDRLKENKHEGGTKLNRLRFERFCSKRERDREREVCVCVCGLLVNSLLCLCVF